MSRPSAIIFSGGSACNFLVRTLQEITPDITYVLGVSDNGGSTSELLRVLGGPSIGDLRSRLTRLISIDGDDGLGRKAIKELLSYRLPSEGSEHEIKDEWMEIVEGRHKLCRAIPEERKETIRGFLILFNSEILKHAHKRFNFRNGSIGNFFLTGARLFFGSLEAAIFLFSAIIGVVEPTIVVPVINTNRMTTIAAELIDGEILIGQCDISHPSAISLSKTAQIVSRNPMEYFSHITSPTSESFPFQENQYVSAPSMDIDSSKTSTALSVNLVFSKRHDIPALSAPIKRLYYINQYAQEIFPYPNPKCLAHLSKKKTLIYSMGSLYTSIIACLILRGIGRAIAEETSIKHKILILNGSTDRETAGYTALNFIAAITDACNSSRLVDARHEYYERYGDVLGDSGRRTPTTGPPQPPAMLPELITPLPASAFITHLIYLNNSQVHVDEKTIRQMGIQCIAAEGVYDEEGFAVYDEAGISSALKKLIV